MTDYDLTQATLYNTPQDVAGWPVTTAITSVVISPDGFVIQFDKRASWPSVVPPGWTGPLQYTIGLVRPRDNSGSACIECWNDPKAFGGPVTNADQIATNWFYSNAWGPLNGWQPAPGEIVGLFVAAGNLRGTEFKSLMPMTDNGQPIGWVKERSNVVQFAWPAIGFAGTLQFGQPAQPVALPVASAPPVAPAAAPVDPNFLTAIMARFDAIDKVLAAALLPSTWTGTITLPYFGADPVTLTLKK